jgi:hypothetical protein
MPDLKKADAMIQVLGEEGMVKGTLEGMGKSLVLCIDSLEERENKLVPIKLCGRY